MKSDVGVPRYQDLLWPTLVALRELGGSGSIAEIDKTVVTNEELTDERTKTDGRTSYSMSFSASRRRHSSVSARGCCVRPGSAV